ncbi:SUN domain-containing protein 1 isoform X6 [Centropristis striata]|uniref:SUN domain-containing protein 1 isoform X6 n=1 Tax=Centropristis striata TaxID=184440 RepID=UPI0027DEF3C8|nr:SUN domain-containing protein 1 isoform X6 [Centropristis striata]
MTMDFSQLHTYTPPQCAPDNTGYTYSLSSSYSTAALEFEKQHQIAAVYESPRMSRRSLRLQTGAGHYGNESLADFSQNHSSSSSSSYTSSRRETRTLRSKKQQTGSSSLSLSLSQAATPRKTLSFSAANTPIITSSSSSSRTVVHEGNTASDASLLSSNLDQTHLDRSHLDRSHLDQSHLRQRTVTATTTTTSTSVDGHWVRSSSNEHSSSGVNGDASASKSHSSLANGYICRDCSFHSQRTDSPITRSSSSLLSSSSSSSSAAAAAQAAEASSDVLSSSSSSPFTSVYSRDRSRRSKTGVLVSLSNSCLRYSKRVVAPIVSLVSLLFNSVLWLGSRARSPPGKGLLTSFSDSMRQAASSSLSRLWLLKQSTLHRMRGHRANGYEGQAHSSFCGSMNVKDLVTEDASHLKLNGSLCDDCKGKQHSETHSVLVTQSSRPRGPAGALWSLLAYTGHCLLQPGVCVVRAGKALGSGAGSGAQRLLSLLWMLLAAPVKTVRGLLRLLATGWYQLVSLMSLLNVFFLTRCLPKLWRLLLLLLPLLLLLALWLWGPSSASLLAYLPAINLTEWRPASPWTLWSRWVPAPAPGPAYVPVPATETPFEQTAAPPVSQAPPFLPPVAVSSGVDLERLERLERQLALLWERVQQGNQKQEQRHGDIMVLYSTLKETLHTQTDRERLGLWVSSLLEQRLGELRGELQQEDTLRAQSAEQQKQQQEGHAARLVHLELMLNTLATKTEEVQQKQQHYEQEKEQEKEKEKEVIAPAAETPPVSVGVKQEEHDLLLEEVKRLEASLSSLEQSILRNVSLQLELNRAQTLGEAESKTKTIVQTVTGSVQHTAAAEGLSEEHVKLIVQNALRLYSQDRTGLVDYALESGGGSILSTRCSETYETKTALMSLFGLPLWYFSQSPRVVIQPDVYPGNCWAFKGSQGYLVIRLSLRILPTSFCVEHIPKALSPTGNITSAPRNFTVFGLDDEYQEEGKLLGNYVYEEDGESLQTFPVMEQNDQAFQIMEVRVLSNWGHPEYTCMYRFRVHGEPRPQ